MAELIEETTLSTQKLLKDENKPKRRKFNRPKGMQLYVFNMG